MYICNQCGQVYAENVDACAICGSDDIKPKYNEPIITTFTPITPVTVTNTTSDDTTGVSGGTKAKGIIGFVMGLESFISTMFLMMYSTMISSLVLSSDSDFLSSDLMMGLDSVAISDLALIILTYLITAIIQVAIGIVAVSLCKAARNSGFESKLTSLGKTFGIIAAVVSAVSAVLLFVAFISL